MSQLMLKSVPSQNYVNGYFLSFARTMTTLAQYKWEIYLKKNNLCYRVWNITLKIEKASLAHYLFDIYFFDWKLLKMLGTTIALTSAIALAAYLYRRRVRKQNEKLRLHRPNWKKDVVYLVQFPVSPHVRSISPFR